MSLISGDRGTDVIHKKNQEKKKNTLADNSIWDLFKKENVSVYEAEELLTYLKYLRTESLTNLTQINHLKEK